MNKFFIWLFIKSIVPKLKVKFTDEGSSFEQSTNTLYLTFNEENFGFMRHLKKVHGVQGADSFDVMIWTILHEIGHYFTIDYCTEDETITRIMCSLMDKETVQQSEDIQDMYFNLESEWEATEWAIDYIIKHQAKCEIFNILIK